MFPANDSFINAPVQLPLAPRPIATELLSSWLLRVAAANLISLGDLLAGFRSRYGPVLTNVPIDYGVAENVVVALARFCRVAPKTIRMLDLCQRVPSLTSHMFLRFPRDDFQFARYTSQRLGYTFCPLCIADQPVIHVPWEWSLCYLARCTIHSIPLLEGCPACGESDPLTFTDTSSALCRSCGEYLGGSTGTADITAESEIDVVQNDYRAALVGAVPASVPNTTARAFLMFFEDIFRLLTPIPNYRTCKNAGNCLSKHDVVAMISALVFNAAPSPNPPLQRLHRTRGVRLWGMLLSMISEHDGTAIERSSIRWPVILRRRFVSALSYRKRKRWPYSPYRAETFLSKPVERSKIAVEFGLGNRN